MKTCAECKEPKSLDNFYTYKHGAGGYQNKCKRCTIRNTAKNRILRGNKLYPSRFRVFIVTCPDCQIVRQVRTTGFCPPMRRCRSCAGKASTGHVKHGKSYSKIYRIWLGMLDRCNNQNNRGYKNYGGRGVKVDSKWHDFESFYADMGDPPPGRYSLDRFPDNDGDYTKANCRWATDKQQQNNRRNNVRITVGVITRTATEWAETVGINLNVLLSRHHRGLSGDALLAPVNTNKRKAAI